jgi:hypothetical protein
MPQFFESEGVCFVCHSTCRDCSGGTASDCTACYLNAALTADGKGECHCNINFGWSNEEKACVPLSCHKTCASCSGETYNDCHSCYINAELTAAAPASCVCKQDFLPSPDSSKCVAVGCNVTCATCEKNSRGKNKSGAKQCRTCWPNAHLSGQAPNGCVCDEGFFGSPDASNCVGNSCHPTCGTCDRPGVDECTSCLTNAALDGDAPTTCSCLPGFFPALDASNCVPCHETCMTCTGALASQCTSCKLNAKLMGNSPNQCICKNGFIPTPNSSLCSSDNCHATCATCQGTDINECITCKPNSSLFSAAPSYCKCDIGYIEGDTLGVCQ